MRTILALLIWPLALLTFLICALVFMAAVFLVPRDRLHPLVRVLCRVILLGSGQWLTIEGRHPAAQDGPIIYMFNHASLLDVFMLGAVARQYVTAVAAHHQFDYPVWGTLIKRYGIIPINRSEIREAITSLEQAQAALRRGVSFLISPEGTRTLTGRLNPFKKGPFHVALNTRATILPLAFFGAFRAKSKYEWRLRPGCLRIKIGTPIPAAEYGHLTVVELRDLVFERIRVLVGEPAAPIPA